MQDVSVVIPTHNRALLLRRAIDSVLAQEQPVAEVIVVDDCSTDDTAAVAASYGTQIRYIHSDRNIERAAARNLGAGAAKSRMVAFLDSDDEWLPSKVASQIEHIRVGVSSITGVRFIDAVGRPTGREAIPGRRAFHRVWLTNALMGSPSSLVLPRSVFHELGGFPTPWSVQGSEDWLLLVKLHRSGHRLAIVGEAQVAYRVHAANSTGDPDRVAVSMWSALEWMEREGILGERRLRKSRGRAATTIARGYGHRGRLREAATWWRRGLRQGTACEAARATIQVPASVARGILRRHGI